MITWPLGWPTLYGDKERNTLYLNKPSFPSLSYAIDELPLVNSPEVFGLHPNAEIGYFTQAAKEMWLHLVELQPQTGTVSGGISRDDFIDGVAKDILDKIPPLFEIDRVRKTYEMNITPTIVVLLQELERFNKLMDRMRITLSLLRKVLTVDP
uniref:Dynein heavy chain C-terminal domain-containing protein n=1 Tax=Timema poppense TaxID=170557 RepID=A0A7R9D9K0_TIMPO|nr:unnamed protein product [Timema poppensis]